MTKATREQAIESLPKRMRPESVRVTRLGSFTYVPKPAACDEKVNGVLANGLMSVTLDVTDKDLRELMHSLSVLEDGLSRRWAELES
ncbi:hypothetical protein ACWCQ1_35375 [Streptomyces sp. NPDC002144]|uniref:hypothetical protein n=1 Tax=Streptomyces sp. NPDC006668 TaxID=3156903 RepID=UPI0033E736C1